MGDTVGQILPLAIAITISPVPIIAVILLLFTDRPKPNGTAFVVGFIVGVAGVLGIFVALASTQDLADTTSRASTTSAWMRILLGLLLVVVAFRQLQNRPRPGEDPPQPKWMSGIASFTTTKSLTTGLVVGAVNPKNIAVSLAAATTISSAALSTRAEIGTVLIYTLIAAIGVAAPLVVAVAMGDRSTAILDDWKAWLAHNNAVVMAVLFFVIAAVLIGKGISGLAS